MENLDEKKYAQDKENNYINVLTRKLSKISMYKDTKGLFNPCGPGVQTDTGVQPNDLENMYDCARDMITGKEKLDETLLLELLEKMNLYADEIYDLFAEEDYYGLCDNKDFILKAIETTGGIAPIAIWTSKDVIKQILQDKELMKQILKKEIKIPNFLSGGENLAIFIYQLMQYDELSQDKEFMTQLMENLINVTSEVEYLDDELGISITTIIAEKCKGLLEDRNFTEKVFDLIESIHGWERENFTDLYEEMITSEELSNDEELASRYLKAFAGVRNISPNLLKKREFLEKVLETSYDIGMEFYLPKEFDSDIEIIKKYLKNGGDYKGISLEVLNNPEIVEIMRESYGEEANDIILNDIAKKIEETGTLVTHFGDDLDNKAATEAIQKWAEDNDLIKIGYPLKVIRVPAGQTKKGYLNVDTGGHKGSVVEPDETIVIDGDLRYGVKSACEALSKLDIYVPEQIVELADTKPNKVSALDSRSGLALVRYLSGEQTFKLAEAGLLDKTLDDEQIEMFGLTEAHKNQQEIIDKAIQKIEKYTVEMSNGEKIVLSPEQILSGSAIAYEKGIKYYVSASEHLNEDKNVDGVTFAITSKPGIQLPEEVVSYGKELVEKYRIDQNSSEVFVSPNNQIIVAGGNKNPNFRIPNETIEGILDKIKERFIGKTCMHQIGEVEEYVGTIQGAEKIDKAMEIIINEQLRNTKEKNVENSDERN